ncbi:MAG: hypothetical protein Q4F11_03180 [Eubacteriales bacterium]|nr:hypothetical protein [Eubacteriales bacterium]
MSRWGNVQGSIDDMYMNDGDWEDIYMNNNRKIGGTQVMRKKHEKNIMQNYGEGIVRLLEESAAE